MPNFMRRRYRKSDHATLSARNNIRKISKKENKYIAEMGGKN